MRTFLFVGFASLGLTFSAFTADGDPAKNQIAPGLKALQRTVGEWNTDITIRMPGRDVIQDQGYGSITMSKDGWFLLSEGPSEYWITTYSPRLKAYRGAAVFGHGGFGFLSGKWDPEQVSISVEMTTDDDLRLAGAYTFPGADRFRSRGSMFDPEGKKLMSYDVQLRRRDAQAEPLKPKLTAEHLPEVTRLLARHVGTWKVTNNVTVDGREPTTRTYTSTSRRSRDGFFVIGDSPHEHSAMAYDKRSNTFANIFVTRTGAGVSRGEWNEKTQTMALETTRQDGWKYKASYRFLKPTLMKVEGKGTLADGKTGFSFVVTKEKQ